jgi:hypothetical protein
MEQATGGFFASIERGRNIPGTRPGESEKVRYVEFKPGQNPNVEFHKVLRKVPLIAQRGGTMIDVGNITLPDGTMFYPLVFHDDLDGWRRQIEGGAQALGLRFAWIDGDNFVVSDGR